MNVQERMAWMFIGFAIAALAVIVIVSTKPEPSPIAWLEYSSIDGEHCPGDVIPYSAVLRIDKPGPIYATSAVLRADDNAAVDAYRSDPWAMGWSERTGLPIAGDTVVGQPMGDVFLTVVNQSGVLFVDKDFSFVIPDLPPGKYVRNVAAGMFGVNGSAVIRSQPFTVAANCGE